MLAAGGLLSSSCASFSTHMLAKPPPEGTMDMSMNLDLLVAERNRELTPVPNLELMLRYGLSDRVDIGGKVNLLGGEMNSRILLFGSPRLNIAMVPGAGLAFANFATDDDQVLVATFSSPVLADVRFTSRLSMLLGAKPIVHISAGEGSDTILYPGGVFGFRIQLSDNFSLFPEVNVHMPYNVDEKRTRAFLWQGGLAFQFNLSV